MTKTVLVVDDNATFRDLAGRILAGWGHTVIEAGSISEGLSLAAELQPDSVLVDIGLPDGDGFDLAHRLIEQYPSVSVILISSDSDAGNGFAAQRVGAVGFIPKDEILSDSLRELIDER